MSRFTLCQTVWHRRPISYLASIVLLCACPPAFGADELLSMGEQWKYSDSGTAPDESWTQSNFDDKQWKSGQAPLGYGDSHIKHQVSFGGDADAKHITTYFRRTVDVQNPSAAKKFLVKLLCDDGCVAYLNGNEILRYNMPDGEIKNDLTSAQTAQGSAEQHRFSFLVDTDKLKAGTNTIAARVHQRSQGSSDLAFDFSLKALTTDDEVEQAKQAQYADKRVAQSASGGFTRQPPRSKRPQRSVRPELEG